MSGICGAHQGHDPDCPRCAVVPYHGLAYLDDDGGPGVFVVEEATTPQSLFVRVGPVYDLGPDGESCMRKEPGIWIEYMPEHMNSTYMGPMLLTPAVWRQLTEAVDHRLRRRSGFWQYAWGRLRDR